MADAVVETAAAAAGLLPTAVAAAAASVIEDSVRNSANLKLYAVLPVWLRLPEAV